jgi:hypothetical protein
MVWIRDDVPVMGSPYPHFLGRGSRRVNRTTGSPELPLCPELSRPAPGRLPSSRSRRPPQTPTCRTRRSGHVLGTPHFGYSHRDQASTSYRILGKCGVYLGQWAEYKAHYYSMGKLGIHIQVQGSRIRLGRRSDYANKVGSRTFPCDIPTQLEMGHDGPPWAP